MEKQKTIQQRIEHYIQFTDEEVAECGWQPNQKLSCQLLEDGSISIKPYVSVDLGDVSEYPREVLEMFVLESLEKDITINEVINNLLKESLKNHDL
jgi:hypothetical protein